MARVKVFGFLVFSAVMAAVTGARPLAVDLYTSLQGTGAVAVVLDVESDRVVATVRPKEAASLEVLPGSILKPLFLAEALEDNSVSPETRVFCRRRLTVAGRNLNCSHPETGHALGAEEALAYSCNSYFAEMGRRLSTESLLATLRRYGFGETGRLLEGSATGFVQTPQSEAEKQLFVLGLRGTSASPVQMAEAYRRLWIKLEDPRLSARLRPVRQGLRASVEYGMAHNSAIEGLEVFGKTGTAAEAGEFRTHGWFVGVARLEGKMGVVAIYLPNADGGDAALLANRFFQLAKSSAGK